ncbi:MAG: stage V sporulation protein AE [Eubacteriales bacterium]|nr:stage V sporulation protein AE [Eubacteriales bacterium]
MQYFYAFLVGGAICLVGQLLIDKTKLTPARILTGYVVTGVFVSALSLYQPIVDFAGAGATVPLCGFGHLMAQGVKTAVDQHGILGVLSGGLIAGATGITAAIVFGLIASLLSKSKEK